MSFSIAIIGTRSFGRAVLHRLLELEFDVDLVAAPHGDALHTAGAAAGITTVPEYPELHHPTDLIVCAHAHQFITPAVRASAQATLGIHPSLLPRHRGRDAVRWTIAMGDPIAGVSVYHMTDAVDAGPIAGAAWTHVLPGEDHHDLWRRLFPIGVDLIGRVVAEADHCGELDRVEQDERVATWEPSWERPPLRT